MFKATIIAGLALALTTSTTSAQAAVCGKREHIVKRLAERYGEARRYGGLNNFGNVIETFVSQGGKTWTTLLTKPDGISCVAAIGTDFEETPPQAHGIDG